MSRPAPDEYEWRDRADTAEWDLLDLRAQIAEYAVSLQDTTRGGRVIYRHEVAERLRAILAS